jgi:uncharacterized protein (TIGR00304 family)
MYDFLPFVGIGLVLLGVFVFFLYGALNAQGAGKSAENSSVQAGGVVFIGPVPIVFGSNTNIALIALAIGVVMVVLWVLFTYLLH